MHPSWHQSLLWHRATQRRPSFVIISPHEEEESHRRCEFSSVTYQPSRGFEKFGVGPGLLSLRSSGLKERRERSANNSFLLLNFLSGERGQVTGREAEEGWRDGGLASDIATKDGRMDGGLPAARERRAPSSSSHCLLSPPPPCLCQTAAVTGRGPK